MNIKLRDTGCEGVNWVELSWLQFFVIMATNLRVTLEHAVF
jgi:hypothetical protein